MIHLFQTSLTRSPLACGEPGKSHHTAATSRLYYITVKTSPLLLPSLHILPRILPLLILPATMMKTQPPLLLLLHLLQPPLLMVLLVAC